MKKAAVLVCMASVLLSGCSGAGGEKVSQTADSCAQAVASELAKTDWTAVSTDTNSDDAAYVMAHTDTVALDRLIAFTLTADGGPSEGACEELRSRFLESPHTVLAYLVLMGDQTVSSPLWNEINKVCRQKRDFDGHVFCLRFLLGKTTKQSGCFLLHSPKENREQNRFRTV